jgi:hypothetical protein
MAVTSTRVIEVVFSQDLSANLSFSAAENAASPGDMDVLTLAIGFNSITVPAGGTTVRGATIIPPAGNTATITLKGVTGDTGIGLHLTDPTSIALASGTSAIGLTVSAEIVGLRIIWT